MQCFDFILDVLHFAPSLLSECQRRHAGPALKPPSIQYPSGTAASPSSAASDVGKQASDAAAQLGQQAQDALGSFNSAAGDATADAQKSLSKVHIHAGNESILKEEDFEFKHGLREHYAKEEEVFP